MDIYSITENSVLCSSHVILLGQSIQGNYYGLSMHVSWLREMGIAYGGDY
jgi:hypothetical protein